MVQRVVAPELLGRVFAIDLSLSQLGLPLGLLLGGMLRTAAIPEAGGRWGLRWLLHGGRLGLRAAEEFGEQVTAASLLHPRGSSPMRATHLTSRSTVSAARCTSASARPTRLPLELIPPLRDQLESHRVAHTIEILADANHGYTVPGMPAYNEAAAEQACAETLALLGERLPGSVN